MAQTQDPDYWVPTSRSTGSLHADKDCREAQRSNNLRGVTETIAERMNREKCPYCNQEDFDPLADYNE